MALCALVMAASARGTESTVGVGPPERTRFLTSGRAPAHSCRRRWWRWMRRRGALPAAEAGGKAGVSSSSASYSTAPPLSSTAAFLCGLLLLPNAWLPSRLVLTNLSAFVAALLRARSLLRAAAAGPPAHRRRADQTARRQPRPPPLPERSCRPTAAPAGSCTRARPAARG